MVGTERDLTSQNARNPVNDGQAKAQARGAAVILVQTLKFLENEFMLGPGDANACIVNFDAQAVSTPPAANQNAARIGLFHGD
jgi:hypothetical protein